MAIHRKPQRSFGFLKCQSILSVCGKRVAKIILVAVGNAASVVRSSNAELKEPSHLVGIV